jgi:hypothetical protein
MMMDELAKLLSTLRETMMIMTKEYVNEQLNKAQKLLWGGSETENIEAHNIIAKLVSQLEEE